MKDHIAEESIVNTPLFTNLILNNSSFFFLEFQVHRIGLIYSSAHEILSPLVHAKPHSFIHFIPNP